MSVPNSLFVYTHYNSANVFYSGTLIQAHLTIPNTPPHRTYTHYMGHLHITTHDLPFIPPSQPGGYVILTTINRILMSYLTAIIGAEYLLRLLPQGTHCWNQFRTPRELTRELEWNGVQVDWVQGMWFNPVTSKWAWSDSTSVNYALRARQTK